MEKIRVLLFNALLLLCWTCQINYASETNACRYFSHIFTSKDVGRTFRIYERNSIIKDLKKLNRKQVEAWIEPILYKYGFESPTSYRAIAIIKATDKYCLLLLMRCEGEAEGEERITNQQYIVSVDKQGKYIDALPVAYEKNLSNWDVEFDEDRKIYRFATVVGAFFEDDKIRTTHMSHVSNLPDELSHEWEWMIWDEIIYSVNENGKIIEIVPRRKIKEGK